MNASTLPGSLEDIATELRDAPHDLLLEVLLEYADRLPRVPERLADRPEGMEQVTECQTPFFLAAELDEDGGLRVHIDCPPESPTIRAFGAIVVEGLAGAAPEDAAALPDDLAERLGLGSAITGMRLNGMVAVVRRLRRQAQALQEAEATSS